MIEEYFGDGHNFGVNIEYVNEQSPLGTAGALSMIDPKPDSAFIVTNGDSISGVNYSNMLNFHTENDAKATVAVRMHEWQNPYGVVSTRGIEILDIEEKPVYRSRINVGSYVLDSEAIHLLERDQYCDMPTLLKRVQDNQGRLVAFAIHESWMDFTNPEDLKLNVNSRKGY
jgi:NDP-sugar pyrophosphorylase family protein